MQHSRNFSTDFVLKSLKTTAEWLCRQIDPGLSVHFPQIWERWINQYPGQMHPYIGESGQPINPEVIKHCIDDVSNRFSHRPKHIMAVNRYTFLRKKPIAKMNKTTYINLSMVFNFCPLLSDRLTYQDISSAPLLRNFFVTAGIISKTSPTIPKWATSKIGAFLSLLMAMM